LTPYEFTALLEYYGQLKKDEYSVLRNTIYNAGANLMRKKGEKIIPLFKDDNPEKEIEDKEKARKEREALFGSIPK
jgi:hypothetical protein